MYFTLYFNVPVVEFKNFGFSQALVYISYVLFLELWSLFLAIKNICQRYTLPDCDLHHCMLSIMQFDYQFCGISIVFNFTRDYPSSLGKVKTKVMQNIVRK